MNKVDGVTQVTKKNMFVMPLVKAVQELSAQVITLQDEINNLKGGWQLNKVDGVTQVTKKNMFVMPLVKAVQELSAQVITLQDEINTLKGG